MYRKKRQTHNMKRPPRDGCLAKAPAKAKAPSKVPTAPAKKTSSTKCRSQHTPPPPTITANEGSGITVDREHPLGKGGFGCVYRGFDNLTGSYVAVKEVIIHCDTCIADGLREEYNLLQRLNHPNIVAVKSFMLKPNVEAQIVMEWMAGGSISSKIAEGGTAFRLYEGAIRRYTADALRGLMYLHDHSIIHRDVKPANMLLTPSGEVKISDFGLSKLAKTDSGCSTTHHAAGTPAYLAPECIVRGKYSAAGDIWALGCTIVEMATGQRPWSHLPQSVAGALPLIFHIGNAQPPNHHPKIPRHLSKGLRDITLRCFAFSPADRPSAAALLSDVYFTAPALPPDAEPVGEYESAQKAAGDAPSPSAGAIAYSIDAQRERQLVGTTAAQIVLPPGTKACDRCMPNQGDDVNAADSTDWSPLQRAAAIGHISCITFLIGLGARVGAVDREGRSAVFVAAHEGRTDAIRVLARHGASVNQPGNDGATPLCIACAGGHVEAISALAQLGADVNQTMNDGSTAAYVAAATGNIVVLEALASLGADFQKTNNSGSTPMIAAAGRGHVNAVRALAKIGADVNQPMSSGATPTFVAAALGNTEAIAVLAELGANVNQPNAAMTMPLHIAASKGHDDAIRALVAAGATINTKDGQGMTAIHHAAHQGFPSTIRLLHGFGIDVNSPGDKGASPICLATQEGHLAAIEELASLGAELNVTIDGGAIPLWLATAEGQTGAIHVLVSAGADVDHQNADGRTALHIAAYEGKVPSIEALVRCGASVATQMHNGATPLFIAAWMGHKDAVEALHRLGGDINARAKDGSTPLTIATVRHHDEVASYLKAAGALTGE